MMITTNDFKSAYFSTILLLFSSSTLAVDKEHVKCKNLPNIIIIISDDQGYNDIGICGNEDIITPNLDKLGRDGTRFTDFYVTCSGCTPSRGSLFTGRYPQRNGTYELFRNNRVNDGHVYTPYEYSTSPERILGMDEKEVLLPQLLKQAGYISGLFGKWDLGQLRRFLPLQRGFDQFYGFANTGIDYYTHERYFIPSMYRNNNPTSEDKGIYSTYLFEREALRFIKENHKNPFFLTISFNAPHSASSLDPEIKGTVQSPAKYLSLYPAPKSSKEKKRNGLKKNSFNGKKKWIVPHQEDRLKTFKNKNYL